MRIPVAVLAALSLDPPAALAQPAAEIPSASAATTGAPPLAAGPVTTAAPPPAAQPQPAPPPVAPSWPAPTWGAPAPIPAPPTNVVTMPPGYWEQPGLFPRDIDVEDRRVPPPVGYRLDREARRPLWLAGTIIFSISHAATAFTGGLLWSTGEGEFENTWLLMIPVVGPVIWAPIDRGIESDDGRATFAGMSLLTAVQATGLGLLIGGFVLKKPVYRRNDIASHEVPEEDTTVTLVPSPSGATLSVTF